MNTAQKMRKIAERALKQDIKEHPAIKKELSYINRIASEGRTEIPIYCHASRGFPFSIEEISEYFKSEGFDVIDCNNPDTLLIKW